MFDLKQEIDVTIKENKLSFFEIQENEKNNIITKLYNNFINNNPRALWLDFKYKAKNIKYEESIEKELIKLIPQGLDLYFIIDNYNVQYHIYKTNIIDIIVFVEECIGLDEYYIIYENFTKLTCVNDHDDILFIDINTNELIK